MKGSVLSGMRPTGKLHLGHLEGALKNWLDLQREYDCHYFVADWHALTTDFADPSGIRASTRDMVLDWLAVGLDPTRSTIFVQSGILEHAELFLLLGMFTPLPWLFRNPTYKEQQQEIRDKDLSNLGFLGYPVLQAADILMYRADFVPVGVDQVPHLELTREIARRFNALYGETLKEPQAKLTEVPKIPGTDGRKMSKSYGNAVFLADSPDQVAAKLKPMVTDPARIRRKDPGDPAVCPVFTLHQTFSSPEEREWAAAGCRTAGIGCLQCKDVLIANVNNRLAPIRTRREDLAADPGRVDRVLEEGTARAREDARRTMRDVRAAMKL
jgi:tryptophanyl-tRNA synthetase